MHPKCVIFDLGGVVFSSPIGRLGELEVQMNMKKDTLNRHIMHSTSWKRMETGATTPMTFAKEYDMEILHGVSNGTTNPNLQRVSGALVMETISNDDGIPRQMYVETIATLKRMGIVTAALTNNFKKPSSYSTTSTITQHAPATIMNDMFDVMIESSVVGLRKPDPRIYTMSVVP